jgi:glycosyltransferase involved in cell wall biosynthesis
VDDRTGIRVPFVDKSSLIKGFRKAIESVVESPEILTKMGTQARQKVIEKLTWEAKANQISQIYSAVLSGTKIQNTVRF